ncbi:hypothetical protein CCO02nite_29730 [Cellulomonas composti]|uniref:FHA domain-containing protein n=1 Tax=Cellulomonas composti TaxID=266130 RepID=A0A511JEC3_9CELL|nr:hypothetical protein CCO02nite_29730 [Cellulomonas composti]
MAAPASGLGAAFFGAATVGVGPRLLAFLVDCVVVALVATLVLVLGGPVLAALVAVEIAVGVVVWEARTGCTFGNLALGLRAARQEAPYAPGLRRGALRALVVAAGHLVAGVGQWLVIGSVAFDRGALHQGWHDRVARAVVVDVRRSGPTAASPVAPAAPVSTLAPVAPVAASGTGGSVATVGSRVPSPSGVSAVSSGSTSATRPAPPVTGARVVPVVVLTLDTGEAMTVGGPGVIGRAPRPTPGERCDHVVSMDDPERSLSRTHAHFGVDADGFWVRDAGSGNGTVVVLPSGQALVVGADRPSRVPSGATVRIGDRWFAVDVPR